VSAGTAPLPRIAITVGDPSGIGPEVAVAAARDPRVLACCTPIVYGPTTPEDLAEYPCGQVNARSGQRAYELVVAAAEDALAGRVDAIATAPVNKAAFSAAGLPWLGHTDLLAHLTGATDHAMMFWSKAFSVVLATVHIPLSAVPGAITEDGLVRTIRLTARSLPAFGVAHPRLAVAGVNPHAGESGLLGSEDDAVVRPAVERARRDGINVVGPLPADTLFVRAARGDFDVVVAMYHDQGLVPVKLAAFGESVNVTIGLPIIRTSVDHGTAFDIARQGRADAGSMVAAVCLAARLARARLA
jgi:4-hydroxythreonine-4-phosphate dehydrogenase